MNLPDCHSHVADILPNELPGVLEESRRAGVNRILTVGMDLPTCRRAIECARKQTGEPTIDACVGLHPWLIQFHDLSDAGLAPFAQIASDPAVVAISEIGFDSEKITT